MSVLGGHKPRREKYAEHATRTPRALLSAVCGLRLTGVRGLACLTHQLWPDTATTARDPTPRPRKGGPKGAPYQAFRHKTAPGDTVSTITVGAFVRSFR